LITRASGQIGRALQGSAPSGAELRALTRTELALAINAFSAASKDQREL